MSKQGHFTHQAISDFLQGKLTRRQTAELLGVRQRTVSRLARRIEKKGLLALVYGNRKRAPINRSPREFKQRIMALVEEKYFDFNMTHCLEVLKEREAIIVGYDTFRRSCPIPRNSATLPSASDRTSTRSSA